MMDVRCTGVDADDMRGENSLPISTLCRDECILVPTINNNN